MHRQQHETSEIMTEAGTLHFQLPNDQWQAAGPDQTAAAGAAYLAYRGGTDIAFVTNITVTGQALDEEVSLEALADASFADLESSSLSAVLDRRDEYGSGDNPGLIQLTTFTIQSGGQPLELQQCQVFLEARNQTAGNVAALLYLVALTGLKDEVRAAVPEFQEFLRTIEVDGSTTAD